MPCMKYDEMRLCGGFERQYVNPLAMIFFRFVLIKHSCVAIALALTVGYDITTLGIVTYKRRLCNGYQ